MPCPDFIYFLDNFLQFVIDLKTKGQGYLFYPWGESYCTVSSHHTAIKQAIYT